MFKPLSVSLLFCAVLATPALGFGGFYATPKATDQGASEAQVVIVRDGNRTVMTIAPAVLEDAKELAIVVPVPGKLEERQIHIGDAAVLARLDAYTAPRLVTLRDENPCQVTKGLRGQGASSTPAQPEITAAPAIAQADFLANDYEISVLTQKENLASWLRKHRLSLSSAAQAAASRYAKAGYSFFVAKVKPFENGKARMLRPLQVAFESPTVVLPLAAASKGQAQDLILHVLTRNQRVEAANYETSRIPAGVTLPRFVATAFPDFYRAMLKHLTREEKKASVYLEYAWAMNWCDSCTAPPLSAGELRGLGVFWAKDATAGTEAASAQEVFVTRLRVRFAKGSARDDMELRLSGDKQHAQARYVVHHPFVGESECPRMETYRKELAEREKTQAEKLADLTGWSLADIRRKLNLPAPSSDNEDWIDSLWPQN